MKKLSNLFGYEDNSIFLTKFFKWVMNFLLLVQVKSLFFKGRAHSSGNSLHSGIILVCGSPDDGKAENPNKDNSKNNTDDNTSNSTGRKTSVRSLCSSSVVDLCRGCGNGSRRGKTRGYRASGSSRSQEGDVLRVHEEPISSSIGGKSSIDHHEGVESDDTRVIHVGDVDEEVTLVIAVIVGLSDGGTVSSWTDSSRHHGGVHVLGITGWLTLVQIEETVTVSVGVLGIDQESQ